MTLPKIMYPGMVNSPETTITNNINESDTIIYVLDPARVPEPPNLMTLGTGTNAETVLVTAINDNALTVQRGFQGIAKAWLAGTVIARNFTEYDYEAVRQNVLELESTKETPVGAQAKAEAAAGAVQAELDAHLADDVTQDGGVHGLEIEIGTFTPVVIGMTVAGENSYEWRFGNYYKIGKLVYFELGFALSNIDENMSGEVRVSGLPFIVTNTVGGNLAGGTIGAIRRITLGANKMLLALLCRGTNTIQLNLIPDNDESTTLQPEHLRYGSGMRISGVYMTT